jgi:hypothetical protein
MLEIIGTSIAIGMMLAGPVVVTALSFLENKQKK